LEELIPIIIIFVISSVVSSLKKKEQQKAAEEKRWSNPAARMQQAQPRAKTTATVRSAPKTVPQPAPAQVMQPTVHTHLQPDCETHDAPGSLGVTSMEGRDPCHEPQLTRVRTTEADVPLEGGLTFDWSGDSMVKAIVMQEVLNRPVQRRAR